MFKTYRKIDGCRDKIDRGFEWFDVMVSSFQPYEFDVVARMAVLNSTATTKPKL
jgi:hypothetical protein